jgi:hypothetical protein
MGVIINFFIRPNGLTYSALEILIGNVVFVENAKQYSEATHF